MMERDNMIQTNQTDGLLNIKELQEIDRAKRLELQRREKKEEKKLLLKESTSYKMTNRICKIFDDWYIDGFIGLFQGVGDVFNLIFAAPFIYVSLFKIKSIPLTLACIANILIDCLIGMIPFWVGNICDFFIKSYRKNMRLIVGYVEDDKAIIDEVNKKAIVMGILIVILCISIYWTIILLKTFFNWLGDLF